MRMFVFEGNCLPSILIDDLRPPVAASELMQRTDLLSSEKTWIPWDAVSEELRQFVREDLEARPNEWNLGLRCNFDDPAHDVSIASPFEIVSVKSDPNKRDGSGIDLNFVTGIEQDPDKGFVLMVKFPRPMLEDDKGAFHAVRSDRLLYVTPAGAALIREQVSPVTGGRWEIG